MTNETSSLREQFEQTVPDRLKPYRWVLTAIVAVFLGHTATALTAELALGTPGNLASSVVDAVLAPAIAMTPGAVLAFAAGRKWIPDRIAASPRWWVRELVLLLTVTVGNAASLVVLMWRAPLVDPFASVMAIPLIGAIAFVMAFGPVLGILAARRWFAWR